MRLFASSSALAALLCLCTGAGFFSNPQRVASLTPDWELFQIGVLWSDDFNRSSLGPNWVILGGANASLSGNELVFSESKENLSRQVYYAPWLTCSDSWTIRWTARSGSLGL